MCQPFSKKDADRLRYLDEALDKGNKQLEELTKETKNPFTRGIAETKERAAAREFYGLGPCTEDCCFRDEYIRCGSNGKRSQSTSTRIMNAAKRAIAQANLRLKMNKP